MSLSENCIVERDPATYQVATIRPLCDVSCLGEEGRGGKRDERRKKERSEEGKGGERYMEEKS